MAEITKRFSNRIPKSKKKLIKVADLKNLRKVREDVAGIDVGAENHRCATVWIIHFKSARMRRLVSQM
jgi:hypothetical protein